MNNSATAVIAAPVALEVAARLGATPDPFLMAVTVVASCAFLTPIGHKNNTLMAPAAPASATTGAWACPSRSRSCWSLIPTILVVWPL
jgi:Na+/H+ antiporter NhaD/arsenite permease-like protein